MLSLIIGALIIGWAPIFVKLLGNDVGPAYIGAWRTGIASIVIGVIVLATRAYRPLFEPGAFRRWLRPVLGAGIFFALDLYFWHRAIPRIGAGLATVLANTQVLYLAAWAIRRREQVLDTRYLISILSAAVGVVLLASQTFHPGQATDLTLGLIFGIMTGFLYAGFVLSLKAAHQAGFKPFLNVTGASFVSAVMLGLAGWIEHEPMAVNAQTISYLAGLGAFVHVSGWLLITHGLTKVSAARTGVVLLLQPCVATLLGIYLLGERLGPFQVLGAVLTLTGIFIESRRPKIPSSPVSESALS